MVFLNILLQSYKSPQRTSDKGVLRERKIKIEDFCKIINLHVQVISATGKSRRQLVKLLIII